MRLGLLLGFENSLATMTAVAREGEAAGLHSVLTAEAGRSAVVGAAAVIAATESVQVGTYVVNAYARDPWLAGLVARDLDEMSGGRTVFGVGTGNRHFNDWYLGRDSSKPWAKMRDYVTIVRSVIAGRAGEPVRHEGPEHRIRWRASWDPARPSVPVYLSASGPRMIALAGEVADGVGVGVMSSTAFVRDVVRPTAGAAAAAAGRDPDSLAFPVGAIVSVDRDPERARQAARASVCGLFHPVPHPYYEAQLRQAGFGEFVERATPLMQEGRTRDAMSLVPDEVIDTMTVTGTVEECAARIAEYEGIADELVALRVAQPGERPGIAAYEEFFALAALVAQRR